MRKEQIIEKLRDDEHYYGTFGQQYLSNSNIGQLLGDLRSFRQPTVESTPLLHGSFFHHLVLEPEKASLWETVDIGSRNTKVYKSAVARNGGKMMLLEKEAHHLTNLAHTLTNNNEVDHYLRGAVYEEPNIGEIGGVMWKGKADVLNHELGVIADVKTSGNVRDFRWNAKKYNYDSQAFIYRTLFGYDFVFLVIDKVTQAIHIYDCSPDFYKSGEDKVFRALEKYELLHSDGFDIEQFVETGLL